MHFYHIKHVLEITSTMQLSLVRAVSECVSRLPGIGLVVMNGVPALISVRLVSAPAFC